MNFDKFDVTNKRLFESNPWSTEYMLKDQQVSELLDHPKSFGLSEFCLLLFALDKHIFWDMPDLSMLLGYFQNQSFLKALDKKDAVAVNKNIYELQKAFALIDFSLKDSFERLANAGLIKPTSNHGTWTLNTEKIEKYNKDHKDWSLDNTQEILNAKKNCSNQKEEDVPF